MKILFVEDHPALRYSIAKEMRAHGHEVFEADSAEEALVHLGANDIEVLVTDVGLPGMSGDVFAAEARALRPSVRLVFATGLDSVKAPASERDIGPTVLRKPYSWVELAAALDGAMGRFE
ncbi:MAG: response regulator [Pseudomonadota bacterium]